MTRLRLVVSIGIGLMVFFVTSLPALSDQMDIQSDVESYDESWDDEHLLCDTWSSNPDDCLDENGTPWYLPQNVDQGDVVGLWQAVLYWDRDAIPYKSACQVDGYFGWKTRMNTHGWQEYENISADGIVGSQTWGQAQNYVHGPEKCYQLAAYADRCRDSEGQWVDYTYSYLSLSFGNLDDVLASTNFNGVEYWWNASVWSDWIESGHPQESIDTPSSC